MRKNFFYQTIQSWINLLLFQLTRPFSKNRNFDSKCWFTYIYTYFVTLASLVKKTINQLFKVKIFLLLTVYTFEFWSDTSAFCFDMFFFLSSFSFKKLFYPMNLNVGSFQCKRTQQGPPSVGFQNWRGHKYFFKWPPIT